jgi:hypothetical protein
MKHLRREETGPRPAHTRNEALERGLSVCEYRSGREADARTRTGDPFITSEVLYQLSYVGAGLLL